MENKLKERQKLFCDEYLIDLNATQAAIRAGYAEKYAHTNAPKLLDNPKIKKYLAERMSEKKSELIATQDEVLQYYTSVMRGQSTSSVLARQYNGSEKVIQKPPDEKERLKAADALAKRFGLDSEALEKQARIEKLQAEIARLKGETTDNENKDDGFIEALRSEAQEIWEDEQ